MAFDVDYQTERHLSVQQQQWPHLDAGQERERIRGALLTGNAWLFPEGAMHPLGQMDLFAEAA